MDQDATHQTHHVTEPRVYYIVYALLVILMLMTVGASYVNMGGALNNIVAMTIATIKAALVVLFFMQVKMGTRLTWVWASIGFIWLIFLFGTLGDYVTRNWISVTGW
jgi:cytochrome c oxidase subunit 4